MGGRAAGSGTGGFWRGFGFHRLSGARAHKEPYLRRAFTRFVPDENYEEFASQDWVYQYAVFITLKNKNGGVCWLDWEEDDRNWIQEQKGDFPEELEEEIQYQMFLQYTFFCQWMELKSYVNGLGIRVMGDLPFYVGLDSLDVWANAKNFLLDENFRPTYIAGVPPDYFSPTGQRWGNPIYDWDYMKKTDYRFWTERIGYNKALFDIVRIDHFRAFDTFWKIPADCPTAMDGEWVEAPGYEVFDQLLKLYPEIEIVIEDLGMLRPEVGVLRDHYGFKGMKIYQFSLDPKEENNDFPDRENLILYTGTHDNQTIKGCIWVRRRTYRKAWIRSWRRRDAGTEDRPPVRRGGDAERGSAGGDYGAGYPGSGRRSQNQYAGNRGKPQLGMADRQSGGTEKRNPRDSENLCENRPDLTEKSGIHGGREKCRCSSLSPVDSGFFL